MNIFEKKKIEFEFKSFISKNFERPNDCRNSESVRFYIDMLSKKIDEHERAFQYAPDWAYALLAQYNHAHDRIVHKNFVEAYS